MQDSSPLVTVGLLVSAAFGGWYSGKADQTPEVLRAERAREQENGLSQLIALQRQTLDLCRAASSKPTGLQLTWELSLLIFLLGALAGWFVCSAWASATQSCKKRPVPIRRTPPESFRFLEALQDDVYTPSSYKAGRA